MPLKSRFALCLSLLHYKYLFVSQFISFFSKLFLNFFTLCEIPDTVSLKSSFCVQTLCKTALLSFAFAVPPALYATAVINRKNYAISLYNFSEMKYNVFTNPSYELRQKGVYYEKKNNRRHFGGSNDCRRGIGFCCLFPLSAHRL